MREIQCLTDFWVGRPTALDGVFGPDTLEAVKEDQSLLGTTADGIVGPDTWRRMRTTTHHLSAPADPVRGPHTARRNGPSQTSPHHPHGKGTTTMRIRPTVLTACLAAVLTGGGLALAGPAAATDHLSQITTDGCGEIDFVDYGSGAPGGGNNDDYLEIHDWCSDGHGVEGYAWLDGTYLGKKYNGNGLAGAPVIWDPFGNVKSGHTIGIKVCLVDGPDDATPAKCLSAEATIDG